MRLRSFHFRFICTISSHTSSRLENTVFKTIRYKYYSNFPSFEAYHQTKLIWFFIFPFLYFSWQIMNPWLTTYEHENHSGIIIFIYIRGSILGTDGKREDYKVAEHGDRTREYM